ncbi:hypothetical protein [Mesorhizobium sophorae]|uniref:hypothetical protein n=1 Tax=Mesorhizobium sophorae TaxID=1300294 RepID=UPI000BA3373E|nr:hypothetical protein [Mesorhizobium sophorae]
MTKPGRKSAAAIEIALLRQPQAEQRPDADYSLTDEEAAVWKATLEALPAGWVSAGGLPVLSAYCRVVVNMRRLGQLAHQAAHKTKPYDYQHHFSCIREHGRQAQVLKTLATALRLTPQSTMRADASGRTLRDFDPDEVKPWE